MTMQQIKRKIELELENKRDELFEMIDSFVEDQKKLVYNVWCCQNYIYVIIHNFRLGQSINEDGFSTVNRICQEIDNTLLMTGYVSLLLSFLISKLKKILKVYDQKKSIIILILSALILKVFVPER